MPSRALKRGVGGESHETDRRQHMRRLAARPWDTMVRLRAQAPLSYPPPAAKWLQSVLPLRSSAGALGKAASVLESHMDSLKIFGIMLLVAGVLALAYGGFSYTKDTTAVKLGPIELSVKEKESVNIPVWAGAGAILAGGLLLLMGSKRS